VTKSAYFPLSMPFTTLTFLLGIVIILRLIVASIAPLHPDEAYYWLWSKHLSWGYYDHPPMVSYWIRLGTEIMGDSALGVRLLFCLSLIPLCALVMDMARRVHGLEAQNLSALYLLSSLMILGGMLATPDAPLVLFFTLSLRMLLRLLETGDGRYWYGFAISACLCVLSKYMGLFLGIGVIAWLIFTPSQRHWLRSRDFWLAGLLFLILMTPHLLWLGENHFVSVIKQFSRLGSFDPKPAHPALFFLEQLVLLNPFLLIALILAFSQIWSQRHKIVSICLVPKTWLLLILSLPMGFVLIIQSLKGTVLANWSAPLFVPIIIALACLMTTWRTKTAYWLRPMIVSGGLLICGFGLTLMGLSQGGRPLPSPLGAGQFWPPVVTEIQEAMTANRLDTVIITDYDLMGSLQWSGLKNNSYVYAGFERDRYKWQQDEPSGPVIIVHKAHQIIPHLNCYEDVSELKHIVRNPKIRTSRLILLRARLKPNCLAKRSL